MGLLAASQETLLMDLLHGAALPWLEDAGCAAAVFAVLCPCCERGSSIVLCYLVASGLTCWQAAITLSVTSVVIRRLPSRALVLVAATSVVLTAIASPWYFGAALHGGEPSTLIWRQVVTSVLFVVVLLPLIATTWRKGSRRRNTALACVLVVWWAAFAFPIRAGEFLLGL